jgi:hypothetical protein
MSVILSSMNIGKYPGSMPLTQVIENKLLTLFIMSGLRIGDKLQLKCAIGRLLLNKSGVKYYNLENVCEYHTIMLCLNTHKVVAQ